MSPQVETEVGTSQAPVQAPDTKPAEILATLYQDYRQADVSANTKFAKVCRHYKDHPSIKKAALEVILQAAGLTEKSAEVEANRINNFRDERNTFVLEEMEAGKLTINEARILSTMKAMNQREIAAKKAAGQTVTDEEQKAEKGRKEFTPERKIRNALAGLVRIAIDNSISDDDLHDWLNDSLKSLREEDVKRQQEKAAKEALLKAASATTQDEPAAAPSDASSEPQLVEAVQSAPQEAVERLVKAISPTSKKAKR